MSKPSSDFTDDSSTAVGLTHRAHEGSLRTAPLPNSGGGIESRFGPEERQLDKEREAALTKRAHEIVEESKKWGIVGENDTREGCTFKEARKNAEEELAHPKITQPVGEDREAAKQKFVKFLMRAPVTPKGGRSKSGRKREEKSGWTCPHGCILERCDHRLSGRPPVEDEARKVRLRTRMTKRTYEAIKLAGLTPNDALACMGIALRENRPIDAVIAEWVRKRGRSKMALSA